MFDFSSGETEYAMYIAPDDTPPIDYILDEHVVRRIYDNWDANKYGDLVDYGGGIRAITIKMVIDAGEDFLKSIHGIGEKRSLGILDEITRIAKEEFPYA